MNKKRFHVAFGILALGISASTQAVRAGVPDKLIPSHGNYCGPGLTGGQRVKDETQCRTDWKAPVSQTDAACQKHDYAYIRASVSATTPQSNPAKQAADKTLVADLKKATTSTTYEATYKKAAQAVFTRKTKEEDGRAATASAVAKGAKK